MFDKDVVLTELESLKDSLRIFKWIILNNPNQTPEQRRESFEELEEHLREIIDNFYE